MLIIHTATLDLHMNATCNWHCKHVFTKVKKKPTVKLHESQIITSNHCTYWFYIPHICRNTVLKTKVIVQNCPVYYAEHMMLHKEHQQSRDAFLQHLTYYILGSKETF